MAKADLICDTSVKGDTGKSFLQFIGYLQVIGIILVVLGHSFHEYPDGAHGTEMILYRLIYSFHMPLFIFISGFLMVYAGFRRGTGLRTPVEFTRRKVMRLLVPYFVLTVITYLPRAAASGLADEALPLSPGGLVESLYLTQRLPIPYFWFLQASFILLVSMYALLWVCYKLKLKMWVGFATMAIILVFAGEADWHGPEVFGLRSAVGFGFYFLAGGVYSFYYDKVERILPVDSIWALLFYSLVWISSFFIFEGTEWPFITSISGIAMCVSISQLLVRYRSHALDHLVGANYMIFLLSWYFNVLAQQVLAHFMILPWWVHTILSLTFGLYVPWFAFRLLVRHKTKRGVRIIAVLLGQKLR